MNILPKLASHTAPTALGEGIFRLTGLAQNPLAYFIPKEIDSNYKFAALSMKIACRTATRISCIYAATIASSIISEVTGIPALEFNLTESFCSSFILDGISVGKALASMKTAIDPQAHLIHFTDGTSISTSLTVAKIPLSFPLPLGEWKRREDGTIWVGETEILTVGGDSLGLPYLDDSTPLLAAFMRDGKTSPCVLLNGKAYCRSR